VKFGVQTGKNHSREVYVPDKIEDIVVQTPLSGANYSFRKRFLWQVGVYDVPLGFGM
jgi:hypothetical protein